MLLLTRAIERLVSREMKRHFGSTQFAAFDLDRPMVGLDDSLGDGQSKAGPFCLGGEKGVEYSSDSIGGNTRSIIFEYQLAGGVVFGARNRAADCSILPCRIN